jgi:hypothetical protein
MPPALICLKEILAAKLTQLDKNNASVHQIYQYQTSLSMNIIRYNNYDYFIIILYSIKNVIQRFVNFITEPYQTNIYAKPIKAIATSVSNLIL